MSQPPPNPRTNPHHPSTSTPTPTPSSQWGDEVTRREHTFRSTTPLPHPPIPRAQRTYEPPPKPASLIDTPPPKPQIYLDEGWRERAAATAPPKTPAPKKTAAKRKPAQRKKRARKNDVDEQEEEEEERENGDGAGSSSMFGSSPVKMPYANTNGSSPITLQYASANANANGNGNGMSSPIKLPYRNGNTNGNGSSPIKFPYTNGNAENQNSTAAPWSSPPAANPNPQWSIRQEIEASLTQQLPANAERFSSPGPGPAPRKQARTRGRSLVNIYHDQHPLSTTPSLGGSNSLLQHNVNTQMQMQMQMHGQVNGRMQSNGMNPNQNPNLNGGFKGFYQPSASASASSGPGGAAAAAAAQLYGNGQNNVPVNAYSMNQIRHTAAGPPGQYQQLNRKPPMIQNNGYSSFQNQGTYNYGAPIPIPATTGQLQNTDLSSFKKYHPAPAGLQTPRHVLKSNGNGNVNDQAAAVPQPQYANPALAEYVAAQGDLGDFRSLNKYSPDIPPQGGPATPQSQLERQRLEQELQGQVYAQWRQQVQQQQMLQIQQQQQQILMQQQVQQQVQQQQQQIQQRQVQQQQIQQQQIQQQQMQQQRKVQQQQPPQRQQPQQRQVQQQQPVDLQAARDRGMFGFDPGMSQKDKQAAINSKLLEVHAAKKRRMLEAAGGPQTKKGRVGEQNVGPAMVQKQAVQNYQWQMKQQQGAVTYNNGVGPGDGKTSIARTSQQGVIRSNGLAHAAPGTPNVGLQESLAQSAVPGQVEHGGNGKQRATDSAGQCFGNGGEIAGAGGNGAAQNIENPMASVASRSRSLSGSSGNTAPVVSRSRSGSSSGGNMAAVSLSPGSQFGSEYIGTAPAPTPAGNSSADFSDYNSVYQGLMATDTITATQPTASPQSNSVSLTPAATPPLLYPTASASSETTISPSAPPPTPAPFQYNPTSTPIDFASQSLPDLMQYLGGDITTEELLSIPEEEWSCDAVFLEAAGIADPDFPAFEIRAPDVPQLTPPAVVDRGSELVLEPGYLSWDAPAILFRPGDEFVANGGMVGDVEDWWAAK
ncbi:uncharacterized protein H6S33_012985 [Morchella sextelata]|uniref:uncharacterized protein n=1 Tax=Morchella sextelata TaxID=1174677 RepID=UPI001D03CF60|nr:uncharacterized protein H6S33_012985 [Morchella sextelata]KAH0609499.1 hypothetical protein H6S33_012985 [Morchella sextelata]